MAGVKRDPLKGAYYGPPSPPQRAYHRPGRGSVFFCGPGSLLTTLFNLSTIILGVILIVAFLFWLLIHPSKVKVYVEQASLTQFNLASSNTLHYNLSLDISVRNPNKKIGTYYDTLEAKAFYQVSRTEVWLCVFAIFLSRPQEHHNSLTYLWRPELHCTGGICCWWFQ